jgi:excisionase family DNA binding protein
MQTPSEKANAASQPQANSIPPFDSQLRYTVSEAAAYLKTSRMTIYKLLHSGDLEGIKEGCRTFIAGRSIAARCAPSEPTRWVPNASRRSVKAPTKA